AAKRDAEPGEHPVRDERADDADDDVADQAEARAANDKAREPASDGTHEQDDQNGFAGHERLLSPPSNARAVAKVHAGGKKSACQRGVGVTASRALLVPCRAAVR